MGYADLHGLSEQYALYDDASLLRIAHASEREYVAEVIALARSELVKRGIDYRQHPAATQALRDATDWIHHHSPSDLARKSRSARVRESWFSYFVIWLGAFLILLKITRFGPFGRDRAEALIGATFSAPVWHLPHNGIGFTFGLLAFLLHAIAGFWLIERRGWPHRLWHIALITLLGVNLFAVW